MKQRETFQSRLGFLLLSAGCAIGIGNVWRFPYVVGANGGGIFVLIYLLFLAIMGVPVLSMEFAVGRASRKSPVKAYQELEKPGSKWHLHGYVALLGNYVLMMFSIAVLLVHFPAGIRKMSRECLGRCWPARALMYSGWQWLSSLVF